MLSGKFSSVSVQELSPLLILRDMTANLLSFYRILPSTLVLVMCALEVVEWASAST
jgi:hypothetical protein